MNIDGIVEIVPTPETVPELINESSSFMNDPYNKFNLTLPFIRQGKLGLVKINDWMTLDKRDLALLKKALGNVALDDENAFSDADLGKKFWNENNAILRQLDPKLIVERSDAKARYANLANFDFDGYLRLLGIISVVKDYVLIGYEVELTDQKIPTFDSKLTYPTGSTSSSLGKTHNPYKQVFKITPIYKDYKFLTDFSVSSMVKSETKFLSKDVLALELGADCQKLLTAAIDEGHYFNAAVVDAMNDIYIDQSCHQWAKRIGKSELVGNIRSELFAYVDAAYNTHPTGVLVSCLQSKSFPDPIKVGNSAASPTGIPGLGAVAGLLKDDIKAVGVPTYGWAQPPEPALIWNVWHMQASPYYVGQTVRLPALSNVRYGITEDTIHDKFVERGHFFVSSRDVLRAENDDLVGFGWSVVNLAIMENYNDSTGFNRDLRPSEFERSSDIAEAENTERR